MKKNTYLVHYDEIGLKGKNRPFFEKMLISNIKRLAKNSGFSLKADNLWGRILVISNGKQKDITDVLGHTHGISWFAKCHQSPSGIKEIKKEIFKIGKKKTFSSFAIRANVPNKTLALKRRQIEIELGSFVIEKFAKKVCLDNPDLTFFVEVYDSKSTFIFTSKHKGLGGLPTGTAGRSLSLLSGGIDSPVAAYLMLKRGLSTDFVHFHSYPKTSKASMEKAVTLAKILSSYLPSSKLHMVPIFPIQQKLYSQCNNKYLVLLYRRVMLKIAELIAEKNNLNSLITGDCLSQVASQTIENLIVQNESVSIPILRPLISFNKEQIIIIAKKINTFSTSVEPHQDCCSLFVPKHPATKAKLEDIIREERKINLDKMIKTAVRKTEVICFLERKTK